MSAESRPTPRRIALLGSTGSIGTQALEVMQESHGSLVPVLLSVGSNSEALVEQALLQRPERCIIVEPDTSIDEIQRSYHARGGTADFFAGHHQQLDSIADMSLDMVINGITGAAGLQASLATLEAGIDLALANKESLVTAGALLKRAAQHSGATIYPVDSEHGAVQQCLADSAAQTVHRIVLTASGGPFRGMTRQQLETVTPEQALRHPTWQMGDRISIDSATLFNKLLEVIEAQELFGQPVGGIDVVVHPQSIIHALVEFHDGSTMAHLGYPDMRVPIRHALHRGERPPGEFRPLDLLDLQELTFEAVDHQTFRSLEIGKPVLDHPGTTLGAVLNAADEEAVAAFLSGSVGFLQIFDLVERAIQEHQHQPLENLEQVLEIDQVTRDQVRSWYP